MNQNTRAAIGIALVLLLIAGGIYFLSRKTTPTLTDTTTGQSASTTTSTATTSNPFIPASIVNGAKSSTVAVGVIAPKDYAKPLAYPASISAHDQAAMQAEFLQDVSAVNKANDDINAWADIAVLRKIVGDYAGSAEIWTYLSKKYTSFAGPYASLADLDANYLKNYAKADTEYLKALSIDPKNVDIYIDLYQLYTGHYPKTNTAAEDILKQGIAANPTAYQLQLQLARYYADKGRTADAKVQYEAAATNASGQGMKDAATQIRAEEQSI